MTPTVDQLAHMVMSAYYRYNVSHGKSPRVMFVSPLWLKLFRESMLGSLAHFYDGDSGRAYVCGVEIKCNEKLPGLTVSTKAFK